MCRQVRGILDFRFLILDCAAMPEIQNPKSKIQNLKCVRGTSGQLLIIVLWVMGLVSLAIGA